MKYGIENENLKIHCANCKNVVSTNGELNQNYCSNCGAPLSVFAIGEFEERREAEVKNTLLVLKGIAEQRKTDSFVEVLKEYTKDLT